MILLVMVALVVFGVLALTSSYSDYKLAHKNSMWISRYYQLDGKGQEFIEKIDDQLQSGNGGVIKNKLLSMKWDSPIKITEKNQSIEVHSELGDQEDNKLSIGLRIDVRDQSKPSVSVIEWKQMASQFKYDSVNQLWDGR